MRKNFLFVLRIVILLCGLLLAGYLFWQLFSGAKMFNLNISTQGPVIIVIFGLLFLLTIGAAVSFFTNKHLTSTVFFGIIVAIMALVLWLKHPELANFYRLYFIYGLVVSVLSPFALIN